MVGQKNVPVEEVVDIVDESDKILYQATKKDAHREGLLHRIVIGEVKDASGRWLLIKQSSSRQDPGQLVSPMGGHVSSGEDVEAAMLREMEEELGFTNFRYKIKGKIIYNREVIGRKENHLFVVFEIQSTQIPVLNEESVDFIYLEEDELKKVLKDNPEQFGPPFHFIIKNLYPELIMSP